MNQNFQPNHLIRSPRGLALVLAAALTLTVSACGGASSAASGAANAAGQPTAAEVSPSGDVPDNAVFVNYQNAEGGYTIQYVEGWTVKPGSSGAVAITDIDSAELVEIRDLPAGDLTQYATSIDEPKLQSQVTDYKRTDLKTMTVNNQAANNQVIIELTYSSTSAPDPVTNKTRAVISQRYYIPGPNNRLAILTLTTPDGVDNVDAFRQMLESFSWQ